MRQDDKGTAPKAAHGTAMAQMERLADFCNEVGMLRHTPRSGYAFLGSGGESVAEHSYRVAVLGFLLARRAGADAARVTWLCLFHDLHEARTGDLNYMNQRYGSCRAREALEDCLDGTGLEEEVLGFWDELEGGASLEATLARDADQLDFICNLKEELDKGNRFALQWLDSARKRLKTPQAREIADAVLQADHNRWWYGYVDPRWWVDRRR